MTLDDLQKQLSEHEQDVIDRLGRIETKLDSDFRALYGNGQPGLITKHVQLEQRVTSLEQTARTQSGLVGKLAVFLAWLITTIIAAYAAFFKHTT